MKPLKDDRLVIRVHYGRNYPNAFWNGVNATFGDGRGSFHPFVSIDLVGHEVSRPVQKERERSGACGESEGGK